MIDVIRTHVLARDLSTICEHEKVLAVDLTGAFCPLEERASSGKLLSEIAR